VRAHFFASACFALLFRTRAEADVAFGWNLLGAVAGVIVCDYVVIRRGRLSLPDLYDQDGRYAYTGGVNQRAVLALVAGVLVALAGLAHPAVRFLFDGAWFSAAGVAGGLYWLLMRPERGRA